MRHYCNQCARFIEPGSHIERDPYGTGDYFYTQVVLTCPICHGEDDIEERMPCDECGEALPVDGFDHCIECVTANSEMLYDESDIAFAHEIHYGNNRRQRR
jgi:hypothetical protein